jgi:hypothetical protein
MTQSSLHQEHKTKPEDFLKSAREYIGVPFHYQGRSKFGIDCIGLLICAAQDSGIELTDEFNYPKAPASQLMTIALKKQLTWIPPSHIRNKTDAILIGDIVRFLDRGLVHIGIVGDKYEPRSLIHVPTNKKCSERRLDIDKIHSIFRLNQFVVKVL